MPYAKEAVAVIAGLLRESKTGPVQKVLADGLRYAPSLSQVDLQSCNLTDAYLGRKQGEKKIVCLTNADLFKADLTDASLKGVHAAPAVFREATLVRTVLTDADLTDANLFKADLTDASLKGVHAARAVFREATLVRTVLTDADLKDADFRFAELDGANFDGAQLDGAQFSGALDIPAYVTGRLNTENQVVKNEPNQR